MLILFLSLSSYFENSSLWHTWLTYKIFDLGCHNLICLYFILGWNTITSNFLLLQKQESRFHIPPLHVQYFNFPTHSWFGYQILRYLFCANSKNGNLQINVMALFKFNDRLWIFCKYFLILLYTFPLLQLVDFVLPFSLLSTLLCLNFPLLNSRNHVL